MHPSDRPPRTGGTVLSFRYAHVLLRLADGREAYEWPAIVGFLTSPGKHYALFGQAGFLNFFDVTFRGHDKETIIEPNAAFAGQHIVFSP